MSFQPTDLAPLFITLMLGLAQLGIVFMALWLPFKALLELFSFKNILK